jgi:nucleoid-associated protein YgaU
MQPAGRPAAADCLHARARTPAPTPTSATPAATAAAAEPAVTVVDPAVAATDQPDEEAAAATPEPEEEATRDTFDYTVRGGDTLADIACASTRRCRRCAN